VGIGSDQRLLCACALNGEIRGVVGDGSGPVANAVVRLQGTDASTRTTSAASSPWTWPVESLGPSPRLRWASGYYIAGPFLLHQGQSMSGSPQGAPPDR